MSQTLQYETPENVRVEYRTAGLGTRFVAWFIDSIIVWFLVFVACLLLLIVAAATSGLVENIAHKIQESVGDDAQREPEMIVMYFAGIATLVLGFSSFIYFGASELFLRGQTFGKRVCSIRVVKLDGFALDAGSIILRNVFRIADQIPVLWVVPLVSRQSQRFGDMVAGTIVVSDQAEELSSVRQQLAQRTAAEARFRFDHAKLGRLRASDIEAAERILERWPKLGADQQQTLADRLITALCTRMQVEAPPAADRRAFLEDLLAAEFRRQERHLH
ncbi:MAG TPA: RDD family protein [Pirellulales bacterium]|nr:RDD family protein [Pirellulales bacterium]